AHLVVDMDSCAVLPARISALIGALRELISRLALGNRIPQIEIAVGEQSQALALRVLDRLSGGDFDLLRAFSVRHGIDVYLQSAGPDSLYPLDTVTAHPLTYRLPDFDLTLHFEPSDFTQVNFAVNRILVRRAVALLEPRAGLCVADLFCGLGNFSLAIARRGA